ncbi:MAG: RHS repeat-associated core domain-containing protein [Chloroflexota bacterium]
MSKDEGGNVTSYTYDNGDRMLTAGGVGYAYDNNGNQTGRGADTFGWDYENRLISATVNGTSVSYTYRGDGLRHSKTVGSNTISLRAEALEAEAYTWDVNSGLPVVLQDGAYTYVYGLGLISQTDNSGNQSYFLGNGLGSTEALVDGSGNVIATYKYDVYGAVRSSSGSGSTEYRFTGQQDDADIGYTYLRARYYDPQTLHSYLYTAADPINAVDPSAESQVPGPLLEMAKQFASWVWQHVQRLGAWAVQEEVQVGFDRCIADGGRQKAAGDRRSNQ